MKLLFTGASGFLGKNILGLLQKDFDVETLGLKKTNDYSVNLAERVPDFERKFDAVLHASGKVYGTTNKQSEQNLFLDINYQGTINLCRGLEKIGVPKYFIFISSVAVYGKTSGELITEDSSLHGNTPYALSKIKAEFFLTKWCAEHKVILSILRPSLIAGEKPEGSLGAMVNGIKTGKYLSVAGGNARKSILMAEDIARILPLLLDKGGIYNICDDIHPSFSVLEELICKQSGKKPPWSIPKWLAKIMATLGSLMGERAPINLTKLEKITTSLTFSNAKAKNKLGWMPLNVLDHFKLE